MTQPIINEIDESDFEMWMKNPITKELLNVFQQNKEVLQESILNLNPIDDAYITNKMAYFRGSLEICEKLININFNAIYDNEEANNDEKTPYPW